jgi:sirohydrochlorin cobaltochelatase
MKTESAIVLFAHGARDLRWAQPLERLREAIAGARPGTPVRVAFLELQAPGLAETLAELTAAGVSRIDIAPIFWSMGGHVVRDLPALVAAFAEQMPQVHVRVLPVLAELADMDRFVAQAILGHIDDTRPPEQLP